MTRAVRALPTLLLAAALLTGCGTERAGSEASGTPADQAELASRAKALGIAPELVYATGAPGFTLARQSVGVQGDDGFSAAYTDRTGAVIHLYTDRPRTAGRHEYEVTKKDCVVWLEGEGGVSGAVLGKALRAVHRPTAGELDTLLPAPDPEFTDGEPVRRGDLPTNGDGGPPDNSVPTPGL
ncbi:membrane lipoprotein [Streptomyces fuscichromogenes]|uniref:Membrane protein n=1 Tax=Streptomyces fuscichromogenes TaxID=1324013 RepID=A0A918CV15_9ACTN|nr:membrane lipoprotein [Streptomyces fuscichromogenes]GGN32689.1 membrane protein [Streptomyces fuscichromogenes]